MLSFTSWSVPNNFPHFSLFENDPFISIFNVETKLYYDHLLFGSIIKILYHNIVCINKYFKDHHDIFSRAALRYYLIQVQNVCTDMKLDILIWFCLHNWIHRTSLKINWMNLALFCSASATTHFK